MSSNHYESFLLNRSQIETLGEQEVLDLVGEKKHALGEFQGDVIIMNFILGTWCPMCMSHISHLVNVFESIGKANYRIIIVTTENEKLLKSSLIKAMNRTPEELKKVSFVPGASRSLLNLFGVRLPVFGFAKPATFIIEGLESVKVVSKGIPNKEKTTCELNQYFVKPA